jgi:hypothetical protein
MVAAFALVIPRTKANNIPKIIVFLLTSVPSEFTGFKIYAPSNEIPNLRRVFQPATDPY